MAMTAAPVSEVIGSGRPRLRPILGFLIILLSLVGLWEGYKLLSDATGGTIPFTETSLPVRADDRSMPHVTQIIGSLFEPNRRGAEQSLGAFLLAASWVTFKEALVGFAAGGVIGFGLGLLFVRSSLAERGLMPWVVASQTVPLLAIAPMVVLWAGKANMPLWVAVAAIAAFLSFFPVTINTVRGLRSPSPTATELFRSYASTPGQEFVKLRVPAALPYLFTGLKVAAGASVVGTIVGELPSGLPDGLGRQLLTFAYYYLSGPEKLYAAVLFSALLGIVFVSLIALAERLVIPRSRRRPA
ncbi:MAG TPA: ABC transporter permease [Acidimicrobiia bacterium]|nr:ABC transporter permease [Acidimicrobiia bacterium]